jgi:hypothetical protein
MNTGFNSEPKIVWPLSLERTAMVANRIVATDSVGELAEENDCSQLQSSHSSDDKEMLD